MIRVTTIDSDGEIVLVDDQLLVVFLRDDAAIVGEERCHTYHSEPYARGREDSRAR